MLVIPEWCFRNATKCVATPCCITKHKRALWWVSVRVSGRRVEEVGPTRAHPVADTVPGDEAVEHRAELPPALPGLHGIVGPAGLRQGSAQGNLQEHQGDAATSCTFETAWDLASHAGAPGRYFPPVGGYLGLGSSTRSLPSSKTTFPQPFTETCIREVVGIGSTITFHLSKLYKGKLFILCDAVLLVRLQGEFENWSLLGAKR